jgi:cysteine-rich repeat protein
VHTRLLVGGLLVGGLGAACLREPSFDRCADGRICASGQVCVEPRATCVPAELAAPCLGQAELAPCTTPSITDGVCDRGLCVEAGCGNGVREAERGELCDDGNTDAGDGCGFDCRSDERCGNGVVDTLTGEQCDDGDLASRDGCSSRCRVETARWHLRPPVPSPVRRFGAGSAVDLTRGRLVLFGGLVGQTLQGDTWEYDGQSWRRAGGVLAPQPRQLPAMSFDRHRREVLLIGGEAAASGLLDDVWAWNGSEWSLVTTFGLAPAPRRGAAMTYDPVRRRHVLVGGNLGGGAGAGGIELWELDEDRVWHARTEAGGPTSWLVAGTPPIGFDPVRGEVVLVVVPDTFTWNGTQWRKVTPARLPWNSSPPLVAVPGTGQLRGFDTSIALLWDGDRWQQAIAPFPTSPLLQAYLGRAGGVIAIDEAWAARRVPGDPSLPPTLPQPAALAPMAYDPLRGELVRFGGLIGGASSSSTWIRRGGAWSPRAPAPAPPARNGACLAFDPTSGHVLLFGGFTAASTLAGDTWSWDGSSWTELSPTTGPTPRQLCGMVTHEARRSAILVGGRDATGASAEVWEWTGTWQRLPELPVALAAPGHVLRPPSAAPGRVRRPAQRRHRRGSHLGVGRRELGRGAVAVDAAGPLRHGRRLSRRRRHRRPRRRRSGDAGGRRLAVGRHVVGASGQRAATGPALPGQWLRRDRGGAGRHRWQQRQQPGADRRVGPVVRRAGSGRGVRHRPRQRRRRPAGVCRPRLLAAVYADLCAGRGVRSHRRPALRRRRVLVARGLPAVPGRLRRVYPGLRRRRV